MFNKNNFYFKATHYFIDNKLYLPFKLRNESIKYKSPLKAFKNRVNSYFMLNINIFK